MPSAANKHLLLEALDVLDKAQNKLSISNRWTKNSYARDADGNTIGVNHTQAKCWCLIGAVEFFKPSDNTFAIILLALQGVVPNVPEQPYVNVFKFNDLPTTTHTDILALYRKTINRLKQELERLP